MGLKQVIVVRSDLDMGKGKIAAQAAHAAVQAMLKAKQKDEGLVERWLDEGAGKVVLKIGSEQELLELFEALRKKLPCTLIQDAGKTQIEPGTKTCLGIGPAEEREIDKYTAQLKLM